MRRVPTALVAFALALAAAAPAGAATTAGGRPHVLVPGSSPIDLRSVALGQDGRELVLTLRMRAALDRAQLAAGRGRVCAALTGRGGRVWLCVERRAGRWVLRRGPRLLAARVAQPRAGTLVVRVLPSVAGLRPGALRWSVTATPASCSAVPASTCRSRAPRRTGSYPGRVWRVQVTGCTPPPGSGIVRRGSGRAVALTYDDGPSPWTPRFAAALVRLRVPATFFVLGSQVAGHKRLLSRLVADGHELGNHAWSHANLAGGGPAASAELARTSAAIRRATGFSPCLFRPPYGAIGGDLAARARALGLRTILYDVDPLDWRTPGAGAIAARVLGAARGGSIILSHDGGGSRAQTLAALPQIVAGLRARGLRFTTVSGLLGSGERIALRR